MKKSQPIVVLLLFAMAFSLFITTASAKSEKAKKNNPVKALSASGEIAGTVKCGEDPIEGALVYIPGMSFMAKTDFEGNFSLLYVPVGDYELFIEVGDADRIEITDVTVTPKAVTDLEVISACTDTYAEELVEVVDECSEVEICGDGVDNDCDGHIDGWDPDCTVGFM